MDSQDELSDKDLFALLFGKFGIPFKETVGGSDHYEGVVFKFEIEAQSNKKVTGYYGFMTEFLFDEEGNFLRMGIWE